MEKKSAINFRAKCAERGGSEVGTKTETVTMVGKHALGKREIKENGTEEGVGGGGGWMK